MKIFVIEVTNWNGEYDVVSVENEAFFNKEDAKAYCEKQNNVGRNPETGYRSSYMPTYYYQEITVK